MTRRNIKLPESLFEALKEDKNSGKANRSWPRYFEEQCLGDSEPETTDDSDLKEAVESFEHSREDMRERLERIEALTRESAEAAQSAKRGVEELGGGR